MTTKTTQDRTAALADLRPGGYIDLRAGETVYTILRHVSASGMTRWLDLYVIRDGEPWRITNSAARAMGRTYDRRREALKIEGCGFDAGFEAVYSLAHAVFTDGFGCTGDKCPSNDHSNGDRDYTPGHVHRSGGYALNHRWM